MKKFFLAISVILVTIFITAMGVSAYKYYRAIHADDPIDPYLLVDSGAARIVRGDVTISLSEHEKYSLKEKDTIITQEKSEATLFWPDRSTTQLGAETTFAINKMILTRHVENITVQKPDGHVVTIAVPDSLGMQIFRNDRSPIPFYKRRTTEIDSVMAGSAAQKAGLLKGDHLVSINGHPIEFFDQVKGHLTEGENTIEVLRAGQTQSVSITPDKGILGVFAAHFYDTGSTHRSYSFSEAISEGVSFGYWTLRDYITQFKYIFTKKGASQVGGLGSMAGLFSPQWDWLHFWEITALLSIILAFMNILPIPALDGGHIVFLLYEMVTGRKPSEKVLEYAQMVGIIIVFALLIYANGNDIYRWLTGGK